MRRTPDSASRRHQDRDGGGLVKAARDRKRATGARAEGRLSHAEKRPEVVMLAKKLRRKLPKGGQKSYSEISAELFALGHANSNGVAFSKSSIKSMLEG